MNIPYGETILFPDDRLQAIGNDEQLHQFGKALKEELVPEDEHIEEREMKLQKLILTDRCPFVGKTLKESGIRSRFNCMVVGIEEGQANLTMINPLHVFKKGDIIWVVGEKASLLQLAQAN